MLFFSAVFRRALLYDSLSRRVLSFLSYERCTRYAFSYYSREDYHVYGYRRVFRIFFLWTFRSVFASVVWCAATRYVSNSYYLGYVFLGRQFCLCGTSIVMYATSFFSRECGGRQGLVSFSSPICAYDVVLFAYRPLGLVIESFGGLTVSRAMWRLLFYLVR